jgi:hypothetical protein
LFGEPGIISIGNTEIYVNYLQEIHVYASNSIQFTCHIISSNNTAPFSAESLTFDPRINSVYSSLHPIGNQFTSAQDTYEEIIKYCVNYSSALNLTISKIDNPCNTPFIDKADQQTIVSNNSLNITVLVNGQ